MVRKIPIIYSYIHMKIKDNNVTSVVRVLILKEIISRTIVRNGGLPRFLVNEIIEELIHYKLIERLTRFEYKILDNDCYTKIKQKSLFYL